MAELRRDCTASLSGAGTVLWILPTLRHSRGARVCRSHVPGSWAGAFGGERERDRPCPEKESALLWVPHKVLQPLGITHEGVTSGPKLRPPSPISPGRGAGAHRPQGAPRRLRRTALAWAGAAAGRRQTWSVFAKGLSEISRWVSPSPRSWGLVTSSSFFVHVVFTGLYFKPTSPLRSALRAG